MDFYSNLADADVVRDLLVFRPTTPLPTLRSGRYRTPRKTWYAAAR
jgi:hypothetical protein